MITNKLGLKVPKIWFVIPAAGAGTRMATAVPKQYLPLLNKTVIEHSLDRLFSIPNVERILVVLSPDDVHWQNLFVAQDKRIQRVAGGAQRCDSVLNALNELAIQAAENDWVLVHDAARPCVKQEDILKLLKKIESHPVGGILGIPVSDTLKEIATANSSSQVIDEMQIETTVDRSQLWRAQTPQVFRFGLLRDCLVRALAEGKRVTDESSAVELYGHKPLMIEGREDNIKITRPEDLAVAAMLLQNQILIDHK